MPFLLHADGSTVYRGPSGYAEPPEELYASNARKLRQLRELRRQEMATLRAVWPHVGRCTRALMIELRAQLWHFHPVAMAVERSAGLRAARSLPR